MKSYGTSFSTAINAMIATIAVLVTVSLTALGQASTVVTNSSSNPVQVRDVDVARRQPVQETTALIMSRGDYSEESAIAFSNSGRGSVVPSGKRLVIEHVSARASLPGSRSAASNQKMVVSIRATLGGEQTEHFFVLTETAVLPFHPNDPKDRRFSYVISQCSQATKIYADPGTSVIIRAFLDSAANGESKSQDKNEALRLTISGYWEEVATKSKPVE